MMRCLSFETFAVLPAALLLGVMPAAAEMVSSIPTVEIDRKTSVTEWPFSIERGEIFCLEMENEIFVFFSEKPASDELAAIVNRRTVIVSTNPLTWLVSHEDRALYAPFDSLEMLIKRLAPYEAMGRKLCLDAKAKKEN